MATVITPTIGRVVWYTRGEADTDLIEYGPQVMDAHVVFVWNDHLVNIAGYDHAGNPFKRFSVHLWQEDEDRPASGKAFCEWMPYQLAQAKKHQGENST